MCIRDSFDYDRHGGSRVTRDSACLECIRRDRIRSCRDYNDASCYVRDCARSDNRESGCLDRGGREAARLRCSASRVRPSANGGLDSPGPGAFARTTCHD